MNVNGTREVLSSGKNTEMVKGNMIAAHLNWVREQLAPGDPRKADLEPFWKRVPAASRDRMRKGILAGDWYPFADMVAVDRTIVDMFGRGDDALLERLGEYSADKNVPEAALVGDAHRYLHLHAKMHDRFQNYGRSEYQPTFDGGRIVITGYQVYSPVFCSSAIGFFRRVLQRFGYESVHVRETECFCRGGKSCTFAMSWRGTPKNAAAG